MILSYFILLYNYKSNVVAISGCPDVIYPETGICHVSETTTLVHIIYWIFVVFYY